MAVQTTVDRNLREAVAGVIADISPHQTGSFAAENSAVNFGVAVVRGTNDDQASLPSGAAQTFLGLSVRTLDRVNTAVGSNFSQYAEFDVMSVIRWGRIYAKPVGVAVTAGDPVYFYHTANAGKVPGDLVNADDVGFTDLVAGAVWDTDGAADTVAIIRLEA